jgi:hypothetical protein
MSVREHVNIVYSRSSLLQKARPLSSGNSPTLSIGGLDIAGRWIQSCAAVTKRTRRVGFGVAVTIRKCDITIGILRGQNVRRASGVPDHVRDFVQLSTVDIGSEHWNLFRGVE